MNILSQLNSVLSPDVVSVATIVGNKSDGVWIARTMGGGLVLLKGVGDYSTDTKVYYNANNYTINNAAPNVIFRQFGV